MSEKKLFLLDAFALIFRAHFAFSNNPRISSKGMSTGVVYGFTNTLLEVLQKQKPTHIAVVFDTSAPTFRHIEYPEYKAHRQETPEDIKIGTPYVKKVVEGFGIPVIALDGYEADDLIGTMAKNAVKEGFEVYMMTPDKDFGQLVEENIKLYKPSYMGNGVDIMGPKEVMEKWDIDDVDKVRDILGLQGDSSDNIPGIPGIGPKTASKLLKEYGSVENIIANADQLKGKQKETIIQFGEQGILSKRLATIITDAPIEIDYEKLKYTGPEKDLLIPLFQELEFRTLLKRMFDTQPGSATTTTPAVSSGPSGQLDMFSSSASPSAPSPLPAKTSENGSVAESEEEETSLQPMSFSDMGWYFFDITKKDEVAGLAEAIKLNGRMVLESITDDPNPVNARLLGMAVSCNDKDAYFIRFSGDEKKDEGLLEALKPVLESAEIEKTGHNLKYEMVLFRKYGIVLEGRAVDVMLMHYLIDPDQSHQLENMARVYLGYTVMPDSARYLDKSKRSTKTSEIELQSLVDWSCESVMVISSLSRKLSHLVSEEPLKSLYEDMEAPLMPVLAAMELQGVKIDERALAEMSGELAGVCEALERQIYEEAGETFNINSPKQLGEVLFERMKLIDKPKKTKTGQYATGEEVLSGLTDHRIARDILEYRETQKLKSTYVDALPTMVSPFDGKIHTNYSQAVAATGRLSSVNPNLQNIPIRTDRGKLIRKAFIPSSDEFLILSADYSQIELRIMASFSEDPIMIEAFKQGKDIHAATASRIFHVPLEEVDGAMRRKAKSVNFGLIYGQSAFGLAQNLQISRTEAKEIIDAYFMEFSAVKDYMDNIIHSAREKGYVETISGRRRYLRDIDSRNQTMRGFAERNAINAPIQGSAADIIKLAMIQVQELLQKGNYRTRMTMQVHDELVFEVHKDELEKVRPLILEKMSGAVELKVPMVVESGTGKDWLEAH